MEPPHMSRVTKHAMLQRHISSYDKLLQYSVSRFSCRKLYERLLLLYQSLTSTVGNNGPSDNNNDMVVETIHSLQNLRQALDHIAAEEGNNNKSQSNQVELDSLETPTEIGRYFDAFFEDLQFLKELKKYFDQRIHKSLYEYYYDPTDDLLTPEENGGSDSGALDDSSGTAFLTGSLSPVSGRGSSHSVPDKNGKLGYTVKELYELCTKWDDLLSAHGELNTDSFDIESAREVSIFPDIAPFEPVLRLIPDLFAKSFRALELAQIWQKEARRVYGENLEANTPIKDVSKKQEVLKERILSLTLQISESEETLQEEYSELRSLQHKENRHIRIDEDRKMVETKKRATEERFMGLLQTREEIQRSSTTGFEERDRQRRHNVERKIIATEGELVVLDFRLNLLQEDYDLELLFLPEIVRYLSEVEHRVNALEESLQEKKAERDATEKTIGSIKKNVAKMREIVDKYYKNRHSSGISVETNEAGDSLSTCTSTTEDGTDDSSATPDIDHYFSPNGSANSVTLKSAMDGAENNAKFDINYNRVTTPHPNRRHTPSSTPSSTGTTTPYPKTPSSTSSNRFVSRSDISLWESANQSGGILKQSGRRSGSSLPNSPFTASEGKDSRLSELTKTKTVRWKSPPVSSESEEEI